MNQTIVPALNIFSFCCTTSTVKLHGLYSNAGPSHGIATNKYLHACTLYVETIRLTLFRKKKRNLKRQLQRQVPIAASV